MNSCPAEHELAALAHGDRSSAEVEAHVRGCAACQQHLSGVKTALTHLRQAASRSLSVAPAAAPLSMATRPSFIGKYFIAGTLAEYRDRAVYRGAHHLLDQQVVLTLATRAWTADAATRTAVAADSRKLAAFRHPSVAKVFDYDLVDDRPYTIEEFVRGPGLDQVIASRKVDWADAVSWLAQISAGVAAVRAAGLTMPLLDARHVRLNDENALQLVGLAEAWLASRVLLLIAGGDPSKSPVQTPVSDGDSEASESDVTQLSELFCQLLRLPAGTSVANKSADKLAAELQSAGVPRRSAAALARTMAPASAGGVSSAAELAEHFKRHADGNSWLRRLFG
jgi:hypothetical protein